MSPKTATFAMSAILFLAQRLSAVVLAAAVMVHLATRRIQEVLEPLAPLRARGGR